MCSARSDQNISISNASCLAIGIIRGNNYYVFDTNPFYLFCTLVLNIIICFLLIVSVCTCGRPCMALTLGEVILTLVLHTIFNIIKLQAIRAILAIILVLLIIRRTAVVRMGNNHLVKYLRELLKS